MKKANQIIYGLFGAGAILIGIVSLMFQGLFIPEAQRTIELTHVIREGGAGEIFVGLLSIWCIFNYERRAAVHYCLIVFTFLMAAIHWFDYLTGHRPFMSPLLNSVPLIVLLLMTIGMKSVPGARATGSD